MVNCDLCNDTGMMCDPHDGHAFRCNQPDCNAYENRNKRFNPIDYHKTKDGVCIQDLNKNPWIIDTNKNIRQSDLYDFNTKEVLWFWYEMSDRYPLHESFSTKKAAQKWLSKNQ